MPNRVVTPLVVLALPAMLLSAGIVRAQAAASGPAYQIVLRSRHAHAAPATSERSQTGGGSIIVEQPELNTIVVTMGGSAVVGSGCKASNAALHYELAQDLDILPLRDNVRPPRIGMIGRVIGTLQVTDPGKHGCSDGSAAQGPASANLMLGGVNILCVGTEPSTVACGQKISINHQCGPVESAALASSTETGCYRLSSTFDIAANQGKGVWNRQFAVADFDRAPQLDAFWAGALKPFRAVPRDEFGFKLIVRVVEDTTTIASANN